MVKSIFWAVEGCKRCFLSLAYPIALLRANTRKSLSTSLLASKEEIVFAKDDVYLYCFAQELLKLGSCF